MNFKEISSLLNSLFLGYSDRLTHLSVLFNPKLTNKFDIYNNVRIQFIITDITWIIYIFLIKEKYDFNN